MSRIGKLPIEIPQGVKLNITDTEVIVEGPKGKLVQDYKPEVKIYEKDNCVYVERLNDLKPARSYHGLYRSLINNMITGVSKGYTRQLVINGVGYRAEVQGKSLFLSLGYSMQIEYPIIDGLTIACDGPTKINVSGIDKQLVGQACAEIRSMRPPEPYKGKGIKYSDEIIRRKIGKSGVK